MKTDICQGQDIGTLISQSDWSASLHLLPEERKRMRESSLTLSNLLSEGSQVYGVNKGFGPLVDFTANASSIEQGMGLISHLCVGQGEALSPDVTRFMIFLRLKGMTRGYSAVSTEFWEKLAHLWNEGFTPVIPSEGSVSASGDLVPLAHAALAFSGEGEAWLGSSDSRHRRVASREALSIVNAEPLLWGAREALAFVNGTTASLASACYNHRSIALITRALASLSGRINCLLRVNPEPYSPEISLIRGHRGQQIAAEWIRVELALGNHRVDNARPLQEPYSLRCVPQVLGAVLDQLGAQEPILVQEALGCTDNPVVCDGQILHGGNFHALPVALCSDQQALCLQQLVFLAERQLALLLNPARNGGSPPMLTANPGPFSGLAGVQIAATSLVAKIRQLSYPATLTALPTNLDNQDHVPMALNGASVLAKLILSAWQVLGSLAIAVNQWTALNDAKTPDGTIWSTLRTQFRPIDIDRPLSIEIQEAALLMEKFATGCLE